MNSRLIIDAHPWDEGDTTWMIGRQLRVAECEEGIEWFVWQTDESFIPLEFCTEAEARMALDDMSAKHAEGGDVISTEGGEV